VAGLEICPANHPFVKSSLEGTKRKLARPVRPKEPLSVDTVQTIAEFYATSNSLATLRLLVGFYGFFVLMKLTVFALMMCLFMLTICLFMSLSEKMTSFGKVTPLILPGLGNLRAQFPLLNVLLRVCSNLMHRIHLFVVLLSPNLASSSMLVRACLFLLLQMNSRSTSSLLLTTFRSTARIA